MSFDSSAYSITIRKAIVEGEALFEARVKELPDVVEYAESHDEAYDLAIDTIETTFAIFVEKGREMPEVITPADEYSGRVTLRMPRSLHCTVSENANSEGVSLNQYIVSVLGYCAGFSRGQKAAFDTPWQVIPRPIRANRRTAEKSHLKLVKLSESTQTHEYRTG